MADTQTNKTETMKQITINAPEGKVIREEKTEKGMVITFHDEPKSILERVKTFEDAFIMTSAEAQREYYKGFYDTMPEHLLSYIKCVLIIGVLNGDWKPDFSDTDQKKWFVYPYLSAGLWDASFSHSSGGAVASVGARLCFKDRETAEHFWKSFKDEYIKYLTS